MKEEKFGVLGDGETDEPESLGAIGLAVEKIRQLNFRHKL